ncbi:MAG: PAS domain S-box protein [Vicinamibacteria bacterium]|nr:PAS domain S-box protein [Vicinamibacteria bacterium]
MRLFVSLDFEKRLVVFVALALLPATLVAVLLLYFDAHPVGLRLALAGALLISLVWGVRAIHRRVTRPLQTLANLLSAYREGDFSARAHAIEGGDALSQAMQELNALGDTLRHQRLSVEEATAFLRRVMEAVDVVMLTFDEERRVRLVNRSAEHALGRPAERIIGRTAEELGLMETLGGAVPRVVELTLPGGRERWEVRRGVIRQGGVAHSLVVLTNLGRVLRDEERQAWQRLIRVLTHELNNSLAPIKSVAGSLESLLSREPRSDDWRDDMRRGLAVIAARAGALTRFTEAYSRLARLPKPRKRAVGLTDLVDRVARLETRVSVKRLDGPELELDADPDQLEQALINVLRNAAEAALETGGAVRLGWTHSARARFVEIAVEDDGPGLKGTENLFVPFFTTKPQGSGIGLVLSRQIVEGHGGALTLENRQDGRGCLAIARLPVKMAHGA